MNLHHLKTNLPLPGPRLHTITLPSQLTLPLYPPLLRSKLLLCPHCLMFRLRQLRLNFHIVEKVVQTLPLSNLSLPPHAPLIRKTLPPIRKTLPFHCLMFRLRQLRLNFHIVEKEVQTLPLSNLSLPPHAPLIRKTLPPDQRHFPSIVSCSD